MATKPTYEELEQRVKELEKQVVLHRQTDEVLMSETEEPNLSNTLLENPNSVGGKYSIKDCIDIEDLRKMLETFSRATGFTTGFVEYPSQEVLIATGWRDVCTKFHRAFPESVKHCKKSNIYLTAQLKELKELSIRPCENGLVDGATPIVIKGMHLASLFTGQVFFEKPDMARFKKQAEVYSYDLDAYLEALKKVPVVSEDQFKNALLFLNRLAVMIAETGLSNLELREKSNKLEEEIAERKRVEEALREGEEKYRLITENTADLISVLNMNLQFTYVSPASTRLRGYTVEEAMEQALEQVLTPESLQLGLTVFEKEMELEASGTADPDRIRILELEEFKKDGSTIWMEVSLSFLRDKARKPVGILMVSRDITERKQAEDVIRESKERFELAMKFSNDGLFDWNLETNKIYYSSGWKRMLGYEDDEIKNEFSEWERLTKPEDVKASWGILNELLEGKRNRFQKEFKMLHKDGHWVDILSRANVVLDEKGKGIRLVGTHIDITERKRAEEALLESEEKFRLLSEQSLMAIVIVQDGGIKYANQAYSAMSGYTWEEIKSWKEYDIVQTIYPEDRHFVMEQGQKKASGITDGVVNHYSYRGLTKSGEVRWIDQYSKTIAYKGKPANLLTFIDIHNQKLAQETLVQSEKRYRDLADSLPQIIFETDENGNLTFVNRNALNIFGYSQNDFDRGINAIEMLIPEDRNRAMKEMQKMMHGENSGTNEYIALRKDGSTFPISIHSNALIHENKFLGFRGIIIDLTQTKKAEEALRESEEKFRRIFENIQDAYYESSLDGTILEISPSIQNMSQYKREELIGMSLYDIYTDPKEREGFLTLIFERGKVNEFEITLTDKDGSNHSCSLTTLLMKDDQGNPIKLVGSVRDISERKQSEENRKKLEAQLHRAQKMEALGLLAGGVAHDLNNILSGIVNYPELLLMDLPEDSPLRRPIKTIQESGMRAVDVVADLLTLARGVAAGKEVLDLNAIVKEYLESPECQKLRMTHAFVDIKTELDFGLLNMRGSPIHIKKTLMNLVTNAVEAIQGSGTVTISTNSRYLDEPLRGYENVRQGEYVVLSVSDEGTGISPEDFERIFEPFYTKKMMGRSGTGLGLAIVWSTVQDHKGYINVKSHEKGTVFELYLPVTREEIAEEKEAPPLEDYIGHGEKILVVDDEERQREILGVILTKLGYVSEAVASGEEAIKYVKEYPVDLIVLDMVMPQGINGRETYEEIIKIYPGQKAIIASGYAKTKEVDITQRLGAGKYIQKPYTLEKIGVAVKEELEK